MSQTRNVRTQRLRNFTVQIRHAQQPDRIVGTGVITSTKGEIITCAHVVRDALGLKGKQHPRDANGSEVGVYFPQLRNAVTKAYRAIVQHCFALPHEDDVVMLQVVGDLPLLGLENVAILGAADQSEGNEFRSYGFKQLGEQRDDYVEGKILGPVDPPGNQQLLADPIRLKTRDVRPGMSGGAVLDTERNLVVGLVAKRWNPGDKSADDDIAWGVDAHVLSFDPFKLPLHSDDLPLGAAPQPRADIPAAAIQPQFTIDLSRAPRVLPEWVGRATLLQRLNDEWAGGKRRLIGLIGFGGEGKTSLARRWLDDVLQSAKRPAGVFWWAFYDNHNLDEFFEAALRYLLGNSINLAAIPSANLRAHLVASFLRAGRYLFVLDGIEVVQQQEGDQYGEFSSADLREFLHLFAAPDHESVCVMTSRTPLVDLREFTTYTEYEVERLSVEDGRDLLLRLGVHGKDQALDKVVRDWDGHALTLTLLATYLVERWQGDVAHVGDVPPPTAEVERYERVQRVLRRYDEHLTEAERAFLTLFSAFRTPVASSAFEKVFRAQTEVVEPAPKPRFLRRFLRRKPESTTPVRVEPNAFNAPIAALSDDEFEKLLKRLMAYQILRYNKNKKQYTTHPLIRAHYFSLLTHNPNAPAAHERIKEHYLALAGDTPTNPTLDDLAPLIEVVHHACLAGAYDEAAEIFWDRIYQGNRFILIHELGAHETALALLLEFFPNRDPAYDPKVSDPNHKRWLLANFGFCLMNLGRLREVPTFFERKNAIAADMEDWANLNSGYMNLIELYSHLGTLDHAAFPARESLSLARRTKTKQDELDALEWQAWIRHLSGESEVAAKIYAQAEVLQHEIDAQVRYLYGLNGIHHADYLERIGDRGYARHLTEDNLIICQRNVWTFLISQGHRVLGNLDAAEGQHTSALQHYNEALKIARSISKRDVLIEALLGRGRWAARQGNAPEAFSDLNEALDYAVASGYRIYEADIRVALAWAHRAAGDHAAARVEAEQARTMSREMGYHWGQVDAAEVLEAIE
ncbi:MAG TPA: trypsin-like peptidase domain-containing protein [Herpetosiphonaceae bacterium]